MYYTEAEIESDNGGIATDCNNFPNHQTHHLKNSKNKGHQLRNRAESQPFFPRYYPPFSAELIFN